MAREDLHLLTSPGRSRNDPSAVIIGIFGVGGKRLLLFGPERLRSLKKMLQGLYDGCRARLGYGSDPTIDVFQHVELCRADVTIAGANPAFLENQEASSWNIDGPGQDSPEYVLRFFRQFLIFFT